jgi:uncharacterized C2H2 Zn-finger protein
MTEETPYKNKPDLEGSGKMGTEEKSSNEKEMPYGSLQQYKCREDGQIFSSQMELNNHYRTIHGMQAPNQQKESGWSSSSEDKISNSVTEKEEKMSEESQENTSEKSEGMGTESSKGKWDDTAKENNVSMKENKDMNAQSGEYGNTSKNQMKGQYKCQRDGQIFSSQEELNQHNKKIHDLETKEIGSELEEGAETMDNSEKNMTGDKSKNWAEEGSKENGDKTNKENDWSTKANKKTSNDQDMDYNKSSQQTEGQYRCQRDGQVFSSQDELNQHNQKAHNMNSEETNTEL